MPTWLITIILTYGGAIIYTMYESYPSFIACRKVVEGAPNVNMAEDYGYACVAAVVITIVRAILQTGIRQDRIDISSEEHNKIL